jgi:hypothetical protein
MLSMLYDTGARVQELIDLNADDVRLVSPAQVRLTGKGRKVRVVPLMDETTGLLRDHMREHDLNRPESGHRPLFQNRQGGRLSRSGVRYLLQTHVQPVRPNLPGFTQLRELVLGKVLDGGLAMFPQRNCKDPLALQKAIRCLGLYVPEKGVQRGQSLVLRPQRAVPLVAKMLEERLDECEASTWAIDNRSMATPRTSRPNRSSSVNTSR